MESFKTSVNIDISLDGYNNHDVETETVNLTWDLELEMRNYGIKSFIVTVPDQKITVYLNIWGDDEDTEQEIVLDVKDVEIVRDSKELGSLFPHSLEFYKGKWKLVF
jgi:hypothetical protein